MTGNAANILAMVRKFHPSAKRYTLANYCLGQLRDVLTVDEYLNFELSVDTVEAIGNAIEALKKEVKA